MEDSPFEKDGILGLFDAVLFDCDGVLWEGERVFHDTSRVLNGLHEAGIKVRFLTNNSSKTRKAYVDRFHSIGVSFVEDIHVVTSAFATAQHLAESPTIYRPGSEVFVIGEAGLCAELSAAGISWQGGTALSGEHDLEKVLRDYAQKDISAVVMGIDRAINYTKLAVATQTLRTRGATCAFVATNTDRTFPSHLGLLPGSGSIIQVVAISTDREPLVIGKPQQAFMEHVLEGLGSVELSRILMVGDRLDTDVEFGNRAGVHSALVLTGVTTLDSLEDLDAIPSIQQPNYVLRSISSLLPSPADNFLI